jgi:hypothetical protein
MTATTAELMAATRAALHLDQPCPRCGAPFSHPCRTSSGKYRPQVHAERQAAEPERMFQEALFDRPDQAAGLGQPVLAGRDRGPLTARSARNEGQWAGSMT